MLKLSDVKVIPHGAILYHQNVRNADATPARVRVNGKCKLWKTRPTDFQLPVKHGLKDCFYITQDNIADWCLTEEEAMLHPLRKDTDWKDYFEATGQQPTRFFCSRCKDVKQIPKHPGGTGYGITKDKKLHCYECCAKDDQEDMIKTGQKYLYISENKEPQFACKYMVSNWPGTLKFTVPFYKMNKHNWAKTRLDFWFKGPDGFVLHGVNIGDTESCQCKRTKATKF